MRAKQEAQGSIIVRTRGNRKYYYYCRSYRVKIDPNAKGKTKGSGKSRVVSEQIYLGTAENVLRIIKEAVKQREPKEALTKEFGLPMALFGIAERIGFRDVVNRVVPQRIQGISVGDFLLIAAINRVGNQHSKRRIGQWYQKTALGRFQKVDGKKLSSKSFWRAFEKIVSERSVKEEKAVRGYAPNEKIDIDELHEVLDETKIREIEKGLWENLARRFSLILDAVLYDTTNFYTFHDVQTPNSLAQFGKSKEGRDDKRLVGLQLAVLKGLGIPIFHNVYCGSAHDARLFPSAVRTLVARYHAVAEGTEDLVLIFDKGNNSRGNVQSLKSEKIPVHFVGTLTPSHHPDLLRIPLEDYTEKVNGYRVHRTQKEVFGSRKTIVITYNEALARRKEHAFESQMKRAMKEARSFFQNLLRASPQEAEAQMKAFLKTKRIGTSQALRFYNLRVWHNGRVNCLSLRRKPKEVKLKKSAFGKNIIFTDLHDASTETILAYHKSGTSEIEDSFHHLKDRDLVSYYPGYHWTDSKIRVHAFVCVMALLLLKLLWLLARQEGLHMSTKVLIEELQDIQLVILVYPGGKAARKVSRMSSVQRKLYTLYKLDKYT